MEALVETHSADEVERALAAGARIIGVNNRDLDTLVTDVSLAAAAARRWCRRDVRLRRRERHLAPASRSPRWSMPASMRC